MIKLIKGPVPHILQIKGPEWAGVVRDKLAANEPLTNTEKSRYSHQDIKAAIVAETFGKCAYCESKIRHVAYGDIEHITAKNNDPELWFSWKNLTLACDICNTNKGTKSGIVDPYGQDPEERIIFFGHAALPIPGDEDAALTIRFLDLNRDELVSKRQERIEYLCKFLSTIAQTANPELKEILRADFELELEDSKEYVALSRSLYREISSRGI